MRYNLITLLILLSINSIFNSAIAQDKNKQIESYCKIWGITKYFSNKTFNWDQVFFKDYNTLTKVNLSTLEFNQLIYELLIKANPAESPTSDTSIRKEDLYKYWGIKNSEQYYFNTNFDWIAETINIDTKNKQLIINVLKTFKSKKPKSLKGKNTIHFKEIKYDVFDEKTTLLSLLRIYNIIEYYYPYKKIMDNSWSSSLKKVIPVFLASKTKEDYLKANALLSSYIQDSHVEIETKNIKRPVNESGQIAINPITIEFAENIFFISNILNDSIANLYELKIGDTITKVNNKEIEDLITEKLKTISISRKESISDYITYDLLWVDSLSLTINKSKNTLIERVEITKPEILNFLNIKTKVNMKFIVDNSIGYIYMPNASFSKIDNYFRKFKNTKTLILDCRGYGTSAVLKIPKLLSKKPKEVTAFAFSTKKTPGIYKKQKKSLTYYVSNHLDLILQLLFNFDGKLTPNLNKVYKGEIIVLVDDQAQSFGETVIMLIQAYASNVKLVGRPTTGANGVVVSVNLPLGEKLYYTGIDCHYANGTQLQRIGIQPDILVPRTIKGIINREDEILNSALEYIKTK